MRVLAFAATSSRDSINRSLVEFASAQLQMDQGSGVEIEFLDLNDYEMPIYSIDREDESGIPAEAQAFFDKIGAADALLVSFAEHNGSTTAAWKNIYDWMSRIGMKPWQGKPMVMLAATPGPHAGASVLGAQEKLAPYSGANIRGKHGIGEWAEAWNPETRTLNRPEDIEALRHALAGFSLPPK
jgi:NAD(P)H-dependent FMN reductase